MGLVFQRMALMPMLRATMVFEDDNKHGWTETYYNKAAGTVSGMLAVAKTLMNKRKELNGDTARIAYIRVSDDLVKRDSLLAVIPDGSGTTQGFGGVPSESANYAVKVRLDALDPTKHGRIFLSGIPDECTDNAGKFIPTTRWRAMFNNFKATLIQDRWAIKNKSGTVPVRNIVGFTQDLETGNVTITTNVAHGFVQDDGIVIHNTGIPALNGTWKVLAGGEANTFKIKTSQILPGFFGLGTVSKIDFDLYEINDATFLGGTHRNRGRFLDSPVGRRRRR